MTKTAEAARNKWKGILLQLGIDRKFLSNKHGPCPMCGGTDRYRFDDKEGRGTFICSVCGSGSGFDLLQQVKGWNFKTAAQEIDRIVGNIKPEPAKRQMDAGQHRDMLKRLWESGTKVQAGDPVADYLAGRGLSLPQNTGCLRFVPKCPVPGGGVRPAMVALIAGADGKPANLHRTFLGPNGKADIDEPRATMPGSLPEGCAIRLSMHGERLGIAEGIETALAASARFNLPVWAAINATMLSKWAAPAGVREVIVFGDNDPKFGGAAAAYALAHRLAARDGLVVDVAIPRAKGKDWADADAA